MTATEDTGRLIPSPSGAREGKGAIIVAQEHLVSDLPNDPKAQLNLVQLAHSVLFPGRASTIDSASNP